MLIFSSIAIIFLLRNFSTGNTASNQTIILSAGVQSMYRRGKKWITLHFKSREILQNKNSVSIAVVFIKKDDNKNVSLDIINYKYKLAAVQPEFTKC